MTKTLLHAAILSLVVTTAALPAAAQQPLYQGQAVQTGTMQYVLHSNAIGRDFLIEVTSPSTALAPGEKLPVIYALDGGFGILGASLPLLVADGAVAPAFVVSVGYTNPISVSFGPRNDDLMHERRVNPQDGLAYGGGGQAFEDFLRREVQPFVAARYAVDNQRAILAGHSGGGLFAANVLMKDPQAFSGYVIGGLPPMMGILTGRLDEARAAAARGAARKVFVFYTPTDLRNAPPGSPPITDFIAALSGPGSTLQVRSKVYEDVAHNASYLMWAPDALPFLLPGAPPRPRIWPAPLTISERDLESSVGVYEVRPGTRVTIQRAGARLFLKVQETAPVELFATAPRQFEAHTSPAKVRFERGDRLTLWIRGVEMTARRTRAPVPALTPVPAPLPTAVAVSPQVLTRYVGRYAVSNGATLTVTLRDSQLLASLGGAPLEVFGSSDTEFFAIATNAQLRFEVTGGAVTGVVIRQNGAEMHAVRAP